MAAVFADIKSVWNSLTPIAPKLLPIWSVCSASFEMSIIPNPTAIAAPITLPQWFLAIPPSFLPKPCIFVTNASPTTLSLTASPICSLNLSKPSACVNALSGITSSAVVTPPFTESSNCFSKACSSMFSAAIVISLPKFAVIFWKPALSGSITTFGSQSAVFCKRFSLPISFHCFNIISAASWDTPILVAISVIKFWAPAILSSSINFACCRVKSKAFWPPSIPWDSPHWAILSLISPDLLAIPINSAPKVLKCFGSAVPANALSIALPILAPNVSPIVLFATAFCNNIFTFEATPTNAFLNWLAPNAEAFFVCDFNVLVKLLDTSVQPLDISSKSKPPNSSSMASIRGPS